MNLYDMTVAELRKVIDTKQASPSEVIESFIGRIELIDGRINAYITKSFDSARQAVKALEKRSGEGNRSDLWGIPYALKDNICTNGIKTTCSSRMLENFIPPYSAHVYDKLTASGAVLLGKADMDEFAMGATCETSVFGSPRNPHDTSRVPGGSSGGSAAATAGGEAAFALGSDTGGSVRNPAAFCGITGFKPTYGTVSRYGVVAFASSLDQVGTLTKTAEDAAYVMNAIAGHDERDSTSLNRRKFDYTSFLKNGVKGMKIGVDTHRVQEGLDKDVLSVYNETIEMFRKLGAEIVDVSFKLIQYAIPSYYIICCSEASSNLARFDGVRYGIRAEGATSHESIVNSRTQGFGDEVKRRIMLGTYALSAGYYDMYYNKALKVRRMIKEEFYEVLDRCDLYLCPTTPFPAYKVGQTMDDHLSLYLADMFTAAANLTGAPAMSFPAGYTADNLPVGMQLCAKAFHEESIFRAVYTFQQNSGHHLRKPSL